jgi:hypothetical protein
MFATAGDDDAAGGDVASTGLAIGHGFVYDGAAQHERRRCRVS